MGRRAGVAFCLVFSGLAALVYQVIWTRLLGFAFGTTTESISTVLAVFFAGMALGNLLAARRLVHVRRPLAVYAWLELGIGLFALVSLPLLLGLDDLYAALTAPLGGTAGALARFVAAALVLLPPTIAMGATLPVVARGLVADDATLGRWSAVLYAANTFGAVLGAYLCGFWLLPTLGLTGAVGVAAVVNLAVAVGVLALGRGLEAPAPDDLVAPATARDRTPSTTPGEPNAASGVGSGAWRAADDDAPEARRERAVFLAFFACSGFVAIGYEIVWSKVFGIVMEGTLYGFAAVLSAYLFGIALGSLAIARRVDRIRNLPRAFGLLHLAIAACVAAGMTAIPYLPWLLGALAGWSGGGDAVHLLFLLVAPIVVVPTALFGAAFPVLIRIYTRRAARVGEGVGVATAVNTAGSIAASLGVGFIAIPRLGMDATLYLLLLLDMAIALLVLLRFQPGDLRERMASTGLAASVLLAVAFFFGGVQAEKAIAGRTLEPGALADYVNGLERMEGSRTFLSEGKSSIVTVHAGPRARTLQNNGMPEAAVFFGPPYLGRETVLLGVLPYLLAEDPERALVIGLGGANTVDALARTGLDEIDVVELESGVVEAARVLYAGRESPLDDPRVSVTIGDGRHELLLGRHRERPGYDVIASQPSHPWLSGAANLFTEEFFALARDNLSEGGVFALWVNGFRTDPESILALMASFERVFPGALVIDAGTQLPRDSLLLLGAKRPVALDLGRMESRLAEPAVTSLLSLFQLDGPAKLAALVEGPASVFAALAPEAANTDDNAFVETRIPRNLEWRTVDFTEIDRRLPADAPVLPAVAGTLDVAAVAQALLDAPERRPPGAAGRQWPYARRFERLLSVHGGGLDPVRRETLSAAAALRSVASERAAMDRLRALAQAHRASPEPLRVLGLHLAGRRRDFAAAAPLLAAAWERSGDPQDAYDTARALHRIDPAESEVWLDRIPAAERARFPRLAVYEAERALAAGARGEALGPLYANLQQYRETAEGRTLPGVDALLARVAEAAGDTAGARRFGDLAYQARLGAGTAALSRAEAALGQGQLDRTEQALREAEAALPADTRVWVLRVRLAHARRDAAGVEAAFARLRQLAPSLEVAITAENRFRAELGLPLLPPRPPKDLFARSR